MDNRIADANKKTQSAPLPEEVENLIWTFRCDLRRATPGDVSEMLLTLVNADDLHKAINLISDLTHRLAKVEAERNEHRDNATMLQGRCASALAQLATRERECLATMEQLIGERAMLRGRAEAFKARVMEWARGRCECCKNNNPENGACPDDCYPGHITAWTPPQAWEVK